MFIWIKVFVASYSDTFIYNFYPSFKGTKVLKQNQKKL